jgi:DNA-directed RNA polymerase subunit RPC12/RpoP
MELFKCQHCGRKFESPEELRRHGQECVPARVK